MLRIVFLGTPEFAGEVLKGLIESKQYDIVGVVTQPDKIVGRKKELQMSVVKKIALDNNIPVFQPLKIREDYQNIIDLKPDLIVSAAYGQIVGTKLLYAPTYKSINVHGSLLPKYRGGAPIQRAIENGETTTGITIMYMEKGMDSGDILAQKSVEIEATDTSTTLFKKLAIVGRDLLLEVIPKLINQEIIPIKQNEEEVTFAYNLKPEEERIDFNKEAIVIYHKVRSLLDTPMAYFCFKGKEDINDHIKVLACEVVDGYHEQENGEIYKINKNDFIMTCGNHTLLKILKVKPTGKKEMSAKDFINGGINKYL